MAIEIVECPIKNGDFFQFAMLNYQRVMSTDETKPWFIASFPHNYKTWYPP